LSRPAVAILYPRTRPLLPLIAFVAVARIAVNAHFISDTLGGVSLVSLMAWAAGQGVRPLTAPGAVTGNAAQLTAPRHEGRRNGSR